MFHAPWRIYRVSSPLVEFWDGWKICDPLHEILPVPLTACCPLPHITYTCQSYDNIVGHRHSIVTKIQVPDSKENRPTQDCGSCNAITWIRQRHLSYQLWKRIANNFHLKCMIDSMCIEYAGAANIHMKTRGPKTPDNPS